MKLELARKVVAKYEEIQSTQEVIEYFELEGAMPRVTILFDVPYSLNALRQQLDFNEDTFNLDMHGMLLHKLREKVKGLREELQELENET